MNARSPAVQEVTVNLTADQAIVVHALIAAGINKLKNEDRRDAHIASVAFVAALNGSDRRDCVHRPTQEIK